MEPASGVVASSTRPGRVRGWDTVSRWARRMRSSWLPRTQEAPREMARSTTAGDEGPLETRSPVNTRWSSRSLKDSLDSRWTTVRMSAICTSGADLILPEIKR